MDVELTSMVIKPEPTVKELLAKRGFRLVGQGEEKQAIIPKVGDLTEDGEFHDFYNNYTFRKILRHLVAKGGSAHIKELESICARAKLQYFRDFLTKSHFVWSSRKGDLDKSKHSKKDYKP